MLKLYFGKLYAEYEFVGEGGSTSLDLIRMWLILVTGLLNSNYPNCGSEILIASYQTRPVCTKKAVNWVNLNKMWVWESIFYFKIPIKS